MLKNDIKNLTQRYNLIKESTDELVTKQSKYKAITLAQGLYELLGHKGHKKYSKLTSALLDYIDTISNDSEHGDGSSIDDHIDIDKDGVPSVNFKDNEVLKDDNRDTEDSSDLEDESQEFDY